MRSVAATAILLSVFSALYLTFHAQSGVLGNTDTHAYFLPNILYAVRAVQKGGGLLWNPYQAFGVPFFANLQVGLLYPPHWLFFVLDPDSALHAVLVIDITLAGIWTFLLCREMGLGSMPALAGALLVAMGPTGAWLAKWSPMHAGPWAWLPAALFCTERLLRQPSRRRTVALGCVLTIALLPGFPQITFFTYEIVAFRVLWQLLTVPSSRRVSVLAYVGAAALLPIGLGAIQLVPALELVRESVRGRALPTGEMQEGAKRVVEGIIVREKTRALMGAPIEMVALVLAPFALLRSATATAARFYLVAGLLAATLMLGPGTPIYDLYAQFSVARIFKYPSRFQWVADYCVAMLTAIGLSNVANAATMLRSRPARLCAVTMLSIAILLVALVPWVKWLAFEPPLLLIATTGVLVASSRTFKVHRAIVPLMLVLLGIEVFLRPPGPLRWPGSAADYDARSESLGVAERELSSMDRVLILHERGFKISNGLILKTAMLRGMHGVADYEALPTRQFAELFSQMMVGRLPVSAWDVQVVTSGPGITKNTSRRLLDLVGTRIIVSDPSRAKEVERLEPPLENALIAADLRVDINRQSFPRAFVVSSVEIELDPAARLARLANGPDDLRRVALVEAQPANGFTGTSGTGEAIIEIDDPEHVTIKVNATDRAFLVLTDQWYPGWHASVNGIETPILRADHAFRVVEVPAGAATVEFVYEPRSIKLGAALTGVTLVLAIGWLLIEIIRPRGVSESI